MDFVISDSGRLCEIQEEFSSHFPFLRIEFFGYEPDEKDVFKKSNMITDTGKTIGEIRHIHTHGSLSINGHQKVSTLEKHFRENYGINIQVFRKSGNNWLITTASDDWTLADQNKKGKEMEEEVNEQVKEDFDSYHEQQ